MNKKIRISVALYRIFSRAYFHLPFMVIFLYKLGFSLITIEIVMAVYGLAVFTYTKLPARIKSTAYLPSKYNLLVSECIKFIGMILIIVTQNFAGICFSQILLGLGYGIAAGGDTRIINFHFDDGGKFQAKSNSLMFASLLIAGLVGSVLFDIDIRLPFLASSIANVITCIVCITLPNEPGKLKTSIANKTNEKLSMQEKRLICVYCLTRGIILTYFTGFLPYYLFIDLQIPVYGFILILTSYTFLGNISSNFIAGKLKPNHAIKIMNVCLLTSILLYFFNNLSLIVIATVLLGLTSGATRPICMTGLRKINSNISQISNIMESIYSVINITLLVIGGILYQYYGFHIVLTLLLAVYIFYIILNIYFSKRSV